MYIYTTAKICNSWHMFNCKELFKPQIRPPSLILLITASQDTWIFPSQSWEVRNSMMMMMMMMMMKMMMMIIIIIIIIMNRSDIVLNDKREKTCYCIDIASHIRWFIRWHKRNRKTKQIQSPGYCCQQDVKSEDTNCANYEWSIRNN